MWRRNGIKEDKTLYKNIDERKGKSNRAVASSNRLRARYPSEGVQIMLVFGILLYMQRSIGIAIKKKLCKVSRAKLRFTIS